MAKEQIKTKDIDFSFEIGADADIESHYVVCDNELYKLIGYTQAEKVNKRQSRKIFGYTFTEIKKAFKQGTYCLEMNRDDGFELYFENDHLQLMEDGVMEEFIEIIN